jgi:hypothetical protein
MSEVKYDNNNKLAVWSNHDGSLFIQGNINGLDFKMKAFRNEKKQPEDKQPNWKGQLKKDPTTIEAVIAKENDIDL